MVHKYPINRSCPQSSEQEDPDSENSSGTQQLKSPTQSLKKILTTIVFKKFLNCGCLYMEYALSLCQSSYHALIISGLCVFCLAQPLLPFEFLTLDRLRRLSEGQSAIPGG